MYIPCLYHVQTCLYSKCTYHVCTMYRRVFTFPDLYIHVCTFPKCAYHVCIMYMTCLYYSMRQSLTDTVQTRLYVFTLGGKDSR